MSEPPEFLTPEDMIDLYRIGLFPMAESSDEQGFSVVEPRMRALLPVAGLHIPARLLRTVRRHPYEIRIDSAFERVIEGCATARPETWINHDIKALFIELHYKGHAHSVECWADEKLVGGLYGLAIGQVFCGESMFSRVTDASKVALIHLCARLYAGGFKRLDAQFHNPHLDQFGVYQMPQDEYVAILKDLRDRPADFTLSGQTATALLAAYLGAQSPR